MATHAQSSTVTLLSKGTSNNSSSSTYSTRDVFKVLKDKKQYLKDTSNALKEINILLDAFEVSGKKSSLFKSYTSDKSTTRNELNELKSILEIEIENLELLYQTRPLHERHESKSKENQKNKLKDNKQLKSESSQELETKMKEEQEKKLKYQKKLKEEQEKKNKEEQVKKELESKISGLKDSTLLSQKQSERLATEILNGIPTPNGLKLIFKASRDGFSAQAFHSKCDNKGSTVVIVKAKTGAVFGGYTSISWTSTTGAFFPDKSAFLFSLVSADKVERFTKLTQQYGYYFKIGDNSSQYSIYHNPQYGPAFGAGHDLHIADNYNYANLGHSYGDGILTPGSTAQSYLTGSQYFQIEDYEVFSLQ
ncbi:predicted protein [Naegleria gruberi]|uniref:Predicted protein n=1 Tax=Naegleria gruberi TaxID=5762 RepID=D2VCC1_NAEGR|nr:uncharacterized protein NAEGRDRAFT_66518 [Naegleria gruberi]EFC45726.1 predicted protein [Naegleria gruberi]|eukprot:XP_002678470.1 predicted protein [Naegleria gruberi strain NEG-M]